MTVEIKITIPEEYVSAGRTREYLDFVLEGFSVSEDPTPVSGVTDAGGIERGPLGYWQNRAAETDRAIIAADKELDALSAELGLVRPSPAPLGDLPVRERGKPAPGRARRTKAEIEEDEKPEVANISTGEERISPEDAADEAAEAKPADVAEPTIEDVRRLVATVAGKVGAADAIEVVSELLGGKAPAKLEGAEIGQAIARLTEFLTSGDRAETKSEEPAKTRDMADYKAAVREAMLDYAEKFDKTRDPAKAPNMLADIADIFKKVWPGQEYRVGTMPYEPAKLDLLLAGVAEATATNPYKR